MNDHKQARSTPKAPGTVSARIWLARHTPSGELYLLSYDPTHTQEQVEDICGPLYYREVLAEGQARESFTQDDLTGRWSGEADVDWAMAQEWQYLAEYDAAPGEYTVQYVKVVGEQ